MTKKKDERPEEPRYTLAEARQEIARETCRNEGHFWSVIEEMAGPLALVCTTCGESRSVAD